MTTMPIDNRPLSQRRLQFIGIGVNKLMLKSIDIIQSSNSYNIDSSFICWNQNVVHMNSLVHLLTTPLNNMSKLCASGAYHIEDLT